MLLNMMSYNHCLISPRVNNVLSSSQSSFIPKKRRQKMSKSYYYAQQFSAIHSLDAKPSWKVEKEILERARNQMVILEELRDKKSLNPKRAEKLHWGSDSQLNEAYACCADFSAKFSKAFHWGTFLMPPDQRRSLWAIHAWCRRLDDFVDGPTAASNPPLALDGWVNRLIDIYEGHPQPHYKIDLALAHTVSRFPIDIQLFKDLIEGMRMDLQKFRPENFDGLYQYCYHVAGTVGLMSLPVIGIAPQAHISIENVYNAALCLGIASQLTNILRDVGADARMGRIYLPQDELSRAGLSEDDVFRGKVTEEWRNFMRAQIKRARTLFDEAEKGIAGLNSAGRWPIWTSLLIDRQILDAIEANDFNNFSKRASVGTTKKLMSLPVAYFKSVSKSIFPSAN